MYKVDKLYPPEGYTTNEYSSKLAEDIICGINVEENTEKLFRLSYHILSFYAMKFTNLCSPDELDSDVSMAFLKALKKFDITKSGTSFIAYTKAILKNEILFNYYGKYGRTEETKKLKRDVDTRMESLNFILYDKNGVETGEAVDSLEEPKAIDEDFMHEELISTLYEIIDDIFDEGGHGRGVRVERPKKIFTEYIESVIDGEPLSYSHLAREHGLGPSAVANLMYRYMPRLKTELSNRGY